VRPAERLAVVDEHAFVEDVQRRDGQQQRRPQLQAGRDIELGVARRVVRALAVDEAVVGVTVRPASADGLAETSTVCVSVPTSS